MTESVRVGGLILDLQVVPPDPRLEVYGEPVCVVDGEPLLGRARAAAAAVDHAIARGLLLEEATDDHDVLQHFENGRAVIDDFGDRERSLPAEALPLLAAIERPVVMRERCRLRRLRRMR